MAATNRHRKLTKSPTNVTTTFPTCLIQCNSQVNLTGLCSDECTIYCPSFCRTDDSSPLPSPSPATSPCTQAPLPDNHQSPLYLPLKISLIFLIYTFIYTTYKAHLRRRQHRHHTPTSYSPENQQTRTHDQNDVIDHPIWFIQNTGLQPSVINEISVLKYNKTDGVIEGCDCSVCLSEFEAGDMVRMLPNCKHAFHMSCIDTWLRSHTNCPLCRAPIINNNNIILERNNDDSRFTGESDSEGLNIRETGESSELRVGERDEEDQIGNGDQLLAFDNNGNRVLSVDRNSGIEMVKLDRIINR